MKFGRDLQRQQVPEWRNSYFDYNRGKVLIKQATSPERYDDETASNTGVGARESRHDSASYISSLRQRRRQRRAHHVNGNADGATAEEASSTAKDVEVAAGLSSSDSDEAAAHERRMREAVRIFVYEELGKIERFYESEEDRARKRKHELEMQWHLLQSQKPALTRGWRHHLDRKKIKTATLEFYKELEGLESFKAVNEKAFRKFIKKFIKAVPAAARYTSDWKSRVAASNFINSTEVFDLMKDTEWLYANWFEHGRHKVAVEKLRDSAQARTFSGSNFRSGIALGSGLPLAIQAVVYAHARLGSSDHVEVLHTSYLLQLYGGYFLLILMSLFFCLACKIFEMNRINYVLVFEFNSHDYLNWRQLFEIPSVLFFVQALVMYLNFAPIGITESMYIYWPCLLIGVTLFFLFFPYPTLYHHSRLWFLTSCGRSSIAGALPIHFRDVFFGDILCSETYSFGNIELIFCLYANHWVNPNQCNSSHSALMGFCTAIPGLIRAAQCARRYRDARKRGEYTANMQLFNLGKYTCTAMSQAMLSLFRLHRHPSYKAGFMAVSIINMVYCCFWDIVVDWSLNITNVRGVAYPFLRDIVAYEHISFYYFAIVLDVLLRNLWILYVLFVEDLQHSSIVAFLIGLFEVCRRFVWMLLRVENEHCTNVSNLRAYRMDMHLPFKATGDFAPTDPRQFEHAEHPGVVDDEDDDDDDASMRRDAASTSQANGSHRKRGRNSLASTRKGGRSVTSPTSNVLSGQVSVSNVSFHSATAPRAAAAPSIDTEAAVGADTGGSGGNSLLVTLAESIHRVTSRHTFPLRNANSASADGNTNPRMRARSNTVRSATARLNAVLSSAHRADHERKHDDADANGDIDADLSYASAVGFDGSGSGDDDDDDEQPRRRSSALASSRDSRREGGRNGRARGSGARGSGRAADVKAVSFDEPAGPAATSKAAAAPSTNSSDAYMGVGSHGRGGESSSHAVVASASSPKGSPITAHAPDHGPG